MDSCDLLYDKDPNSFLRVFQIFVKCLIKWMDIKPLTVMVKSKKEKLKEMEDFQVSGVNYNNDFSDDVMEGKSGEEMFKEDMLKKEREIEHELNPESM